MELGLCEKKSLREVSVFCKQFIRKAVDFVTFCVPSQIDVVKSRTAIACCYLHIGISIWTFCTGVEDISFVSILIACPHSLSVFPSFGLNVPDYTLPQPANFSSLFPKTFYPRFPSLLRHPHRFTLSNLDSVYFHPTHPTLAALLLYLFTKCFHRGSSLWKSFSK